MKALESEDGVVGPGIGSPGLRSLSGDVDQREMHAVVHPPIMSVTTGSVHRRRVDVEAVHFDLRVSEGERDGRPALPHPEISDLPAVRKCGVQVGDYRQKLLTELMEIHRPIQ